MSVRKGTTALHSAHGYFTGTQHHISVLGFILTLNSFRTRSVLSLLLVMQWVGNVVGITLEVFDVSIRRKTKVGSYT